MDLFQKQTQLFGIFTRVNAGVFVEAALYDASTVKGLAPYIGEVC